MEFKTEREEISASEVPADIRRQIDGEKFLNYVETIYEKAQNYFYGWNGCPVDNSKALELYIEAKNLGHNKAADKLRDFWNIY